MGWFRNRVHQAHETAAWEGPFAPTPSTDTPRFNPMVRTAGDIVGRPAEVPAQTSATSVAA